MITPQQFDDIIEAISTTPDGLRKICADAGTDPKEFYRHITKHPEDCQRYARAKELQADVIFDSMSAIADEPIPTDDNGRSDAAYVQDKRLRVDTRKWILAKSRPHKYGEKIEIEQTTFDGGKRELVIGAPDETDDTSTAV